MKMTENPYAGGYEMIRVDGELRPVDVSNYWLEGYRSALRDIAAAVLTLPGESVDCAINVGELVLHTLTTIDPRHQWIVTRKVEL